VDAAINKKFILINQKVLIFPHINVEKIRCMQSHSLAMTMKTEELIGFLVIT
jgi:hypothetical protein